MRFDWNEIGRKAWARPRCRACSSSECVVLPAIGELSCFICGARELVPVPSMATLLWWWLTHQVTLRRPRIERELARMVRPLAFASVGVVAVAVFMTSLSSTAADKADENSSPAEGSGIEMSERLALMLDSKHWPLALAAQDAIQEPPIGSQLREFDKGVPGTWNALAFPVDEQLCLFAKVASSCERTKAIYVWAARRSGWYGQNERSRSYWDAFERFRGEACNAGDGATCLELGTRDENVHQLMVACEAGLGRGCLLAGVYRAEVKPGCTCVDPDREARCQGFPKLAEAEERAIDALFKRGCELGEESSCNTTASQIRHQEDLDVEPSAAAYKRRQKACAKERADEIRRSMQDT